MHLFCPSDGDHRQDFHNLQFWLLQLMDSMPQDVEDGIDEDPATYSIGEALDHIGECGASNTGDMSFKLLHAFSRLACVTSLPGAT